MKLFPFLLALWMQVPAPAPAQTTPNPTPIIQFVDVRGNRRIPSATIKFNLLTKEGDPLNTSLISRDVRAVYAAAGEAFEDVWVEQEEGTNGRVIVIFYVKEKPTIRSIEYTGLTSVQVSDVMKALSDRKLTLSQTQTYDETKIRKAVQAIKGLLAEKGRQKAEVEVEKDLIPPNAVRVTFVVTEGPKVKIEEINFEGNKIFTDGVLKKSLKLVKETGWLTGFTGKDAYHEGKLAYDLREVSKLYSEKGYVRMNISEPEVEEKTITIHRTLPFIKPTFPWGIPIPFWKKQADRIFVTLKIEENSQYHVGEVKVTGATFLKTEFLQAGLGMKTGDVYNENLLGEAFKAMTKLYGALGYYTQSATPELEYDEEKKLVNVTVNVDEGKLYFTNRILFSGNTTTRDKVIRREVGLMEGFAFNSQALDTSRMRLNQLGYFEEIKEEDMKVVPNPNEPKVDVTLKVQEKGRNTIGFNGGVSGIGGSFIGGNYETNNFLGFGETLTLNVQGGTRQSNIVLGFQEPYFLDRPLAMGFSVFHSNYKYDQARELFGLDPRDLPEGLGFENRLNFQQKRDGFSVYGSHPVRLFNLDWSRFGITYQLDNSETDAVNPATQDYFQNVRTQEQTGFASGNGSFGVYKTRKLIPSFTYNTVDNPYYPSRGKSLSLTFEYNGGVLGGNTNYYRPSMEFRYFRPHTRRGNVIAMRFMGSHVRGFGGTSVPFYERFFPGGDYDLRGFDFRSIGPISFLTRNVDKLDPETGGIVQAPFDDIVYVGGDTQAVFNLEYRIPIVGRTVTLSPFADIGNAWVVQKSQLTREIRNFSGVLTKETAVFLPGTNSGIRMSTGVEVGVLLPVLNAPFRVILAWNPQRLDRVYNGPTTGLPFALREEKRGFKFTVGKTF
jgi:outer membrane protein insertion porin family